MLSKKEFKNRWKELVGEHEKLIARPNKKVKNGVNGIYYRYKHPILTAAHTPLHWKYDLNRDTNPWLMQRIGINATFNSGALYVDGRYLLMVRVEGWDRKSFFAVAESPNGIDHWRFWDRPVTLPETEDPDINVYDMRLVPCVIRYTHACGHLHYRPAGGLLPEHPGRRDAVSCQCSNHQCHNKQKYAGQIKVIGHWSLVSGAACIIRGQKWSFIVLMALSQ